MAKVIDASFLEVILSILSSNVKCDENKQVTGLSEVISEEFFFYLLDEISSINNIEFIINLISNTSDLHIIKKYTSICKFPYDKKINKIFE